MAYLPKDVQDELVAARIAAARKLSRKRVMVGQETYAVLAHWDSGFTVATEDAPQLRGLVDLYDGSRHIFQCLIVAAEEMDGVMRYEFKRSTLATDTAPLDFERAVDAPIAYLT